MPNIPIPQARVQFTDGKDIITTPWFRFLYDQYVLTESVGVEPPTSDQLAAEFAEAMKAIQGAQLEPPPIDTSALTSALQDLQVAPPVIVSDLPASVGNLIQGLPTITIGAEVANVIRVGVQLKDVLGNNIASTFACNVWLSDAAGGGLTGTVPGAVAIGTAGVIVYSFVASEYFYIATNTAGFFDLDITYILAKTYYLNVEYQGKVFSSTAITFA